LEKFNFHLSQARIKSEHTYGIVKGKWASVTDLPVRIFDRRSYGYALDWIMACLVLHNLCLLDWREPRWEQYSENGEEGLSREDRPDQAQDGFQKRAALVRWVNDNLS
jgi:hypothetical protein